MKRFVGMTFLIVLLFSAQARSNPPPKIYTPVSRPHTRKEKAYDYAGMYALLWIGFAVTQPRNVSKISFDKFSHNAFEVGAVMFDNTPWYTNYIGHPYAGSEYYLYSRACGYSPKWSVINAIFASTIFEAAVESFSQPFSGQDFILTPLAGIPIGMLREREGLQLANSDVKYKRVIGRIVYFQANLWFFEDVRVNPAVGLDGGFDGVSITARF